MAKAQFGRGGQMPSPQANFAPQNIGPIARRIPQPGRPGPYNGPSIVRPQKGGGLQARGNAMPSASNALGRVGSLLNRTGGGDTRWPVARPIGDTRRRTGPTYQDYFNSGGGFNWRERTPWPSGGGVPGSAGGAFADAQANAQGQRAQLGSLQGPTSGASQANAAQDLYAQKRAAMGLPPRVTPPPNNGGLGPVMTLPPRPAPRPGDPRSPVLQTSGFASRPAAAQQQLAAALQRFRSPIIRPESGGVY